MVLGPDPNPRPRRHQVHQPPTTDDLSRHIAELNETVRECQAVIIKQNVALNKLLGESLYHGIVYGLHDTPDRFAYTSEDKVLVIDQDSPHYNQAGVITCVAHVNEETTVTVRLLNDTQDEVQFNIKSLKLAEKDDGTYAIVLVDGKPWEVRNVFGLGVREGDSVKIRADNKRIVGAGVEFDNGPVCRVQRVQNDWAEVDDKGERRFIANPRNLDLKTDDRVVVDVGFSTILKKLPKVDSDRYRLTSDPVVKWDEIGGLEDAKRQVREAIEFPFLHPDLFQHYGIKKERGVLLFGPPGCGKTLMVRAAATALAAIHGKEAVTSGFLYVKSPELLDKWIGNTESYIRQNFTLGRQHYYEHGYPAIHVYDEADALMPQRGTRRSSDIADTIVPMFLGEMDGVDDEQSKANPIIFLLTNRADTLDPAATRPGRISRHIKIDRPDLNTGLSILTIHTAVLPFAQEEKKKITLAVAINDLFSKNRLLYRINNEHEFILGDCVNGAMIAGLVETAKMSALNRDIANGTRSGVMVEDFREGVEKIYQQQRGLNHSYDIMDFADKLGLQADKINIDRCFGSK